MNNSFWTQSRAISAVTKPIQHIETSIQTQVLDAKFKGESIIQPGLHEHVLHTENIDSKQMTSSTQSRIEARQAQHIEDVNKIIIIDEV